MEAISRRRCAMEKEQVPLGQALFDELFLLFLLSLVISLILYNIWGLLDLLRTPVGIP
jgi:zona occludens toxin (predicted ATPase)